VVVTPKKPKILSDKSLTKGLQVVEALAKSQGPRGVSELARELDLTKSNVHRLIQTLILSGYVNKEESTDRYELSSKVWRLSRLGPPFANLRLIIRPILREAVKKADDSVLFAAAEVDELVIIDQVETQKVVRVYFSMGQSFRMDQIVRAGKGLTALQMVALANRPLRDKLARAREKTEKSLVSAARLEQIRNDGFALSKGNWIPDVNAVNIPVFDTEQRFLGVLSCFGPATRLNEKRIPAVLKILKKAALKIAETIK
jgi:IclR family KDG regulon transcriptional repressor